jgi:HPt (histidine-containing phosphotransfer) domain-containing protein
MIDWDRVTDLKNEVGEEDFNEVVEIFLEEVDEVVLRLKSTQDRSKLGEDLHFLKGSSLNLGFAAFSNLCALGEKAVFKGEADSVDLETVIGSFDASRAMFLANPTLS